MQGLRGCTGFSLDAESWGYSLAAMQASCHTGFSCCGAQVLEHGLNSCGTWAWLLHGTWDLPGPGIEPVSPALAGRVFTTEPPGKPLSSKEFDNILSTSIYVVLRVFKVF